MELPCMVVRTVYSKDNFAILSCILNNYSSLYNVGLEDIILKHFPPNKEEFTVSLNSSNIGDMDGQQCVFVGEFAKHKKYGNQFKSSFFFPDEPSTEDGLRHYLCRLPNIKQMRSEEIIKTFGVAGTIDVFSNHPERLLEINGITQNRLGPIKEIWDKERYHRDLYVWLGENGIDYKIADKIYAKWKTKSKEILLNNPYELTTVDGIGFKLADQIAHRIFPEPNKADRTVACVKHILKEAVYKDGHLCLYLKIVRDEGENLLCSGHEKDRMEYRSLIPAVIKNNPSLFVAVRDLVHVPNHIYIYNRIMWDKEKYVADQLFHRSIGKNEVGEIEENSLMEAEIDAGKFSRKSIILDDTQKEAIRSAFKNRVTVITGSGGSGKSTICRCIYYLAKNKGLSVRMMCPTGKASKVLADKTGAVATTIHRALKIKPNDELPRENIEDDLIIIDEVSMVGLDTMYPLFKAMDSNIWANIVFVGDPNQLPSVSPGNMLFDIINSGCANVVKLDKIHRQSEHSYIPLLANDISQGKCVEIPQDATDISFKTVINAEETVDMVKESIKNFLDEGNDIEDLQVMSPMYKGFGGIIAINSGIQEMMADIHGTKDDCIQGEFSKFYVGDRVLQMVNNYDKEIFNGDMGTVIEVGEKVMDSTKNDKPEKYMLVDFYGDRYTYSGESIKELKVSWCCSVHKYQGSQTPNVIFIMLNEAMVMMNKELVYTAMTRASKKLEIYGHRQLFRFAPTKSVTRKRLTNIVNIVQELRESRKILQISGETK